MLSLPTAESVVSSAVAETSVAGALTPIPRGFDQSHSQVLYRRVPALQARLEVANRVSETARPVYGRASALRAVVEDGRAGAEGNGAVGVGEAVERVAMALAGAAAEVERHPVEGVRELAESSSERDVEAPIDDRHPGEIALTARGAPDESPEGEALSGSDRRSVDPLGGNAEVGDLVLLERIPGLRIVAHQPRPVAEAEM